MLFVVQVRDAAFVARPAQLSAIAARAEVEMVSIILDGAFDDMAPDHDDEFVVKATGPRPKAPCVGCHCRFDSVEDALGSAHLVRCQCGGVR